MPFLLNVDTEKEDPQNIERHGGTDTIQNEKAFLQHGVFGIMNLQAIKQICDGGANTQGYK